jgi:hypothetical protein
MKREIQGPSDYHWHTCWLAPFSDWWQVLCLQQRYAWYFGIVIRAEIWKHAEPRRLDTSSRNTIGPEPHLLQPKADCKPVTYNICTPFPSHSCLSSEISPSLLLQSCVMRGHYFSFHSVAVTVVVAVDPVAGDMEPGEVTCTTQVPVLLKLPTLEGSSTVGAVPCTSSGV